MNYIRQLGLWDGKSFLEIGFILARVEMDFKKSILMTDVVEVGVKVSHLGNKSLDMDYLIRESNTGQIFAEGRTIQVAYDYETRKTIPVPDHWCDVIQSYEGLDENG